MLGNVECHQRYEKPVDDLVKEINNNDKLDDETDLGLEWGQAVGLVERDGSRVVTLLDLVDDAALELRRWAFVTELKVKRHELVEPELKRRLVQRRDEGLALEFSVEEYEHLGLINVNWSETENRYMHEHLKVEWNSCISLGDTPGEGPFFVPCSPETDPTRLLKDVKDSYQEVPGSKGFSKYLKDELEEKAKDAVRALSWRELQQNLDELGVKVDMDHSEPDERKKLLEVELLKHKTNQPIRHVKIEKDQLEKFKGQFKKEKFEYELKNNHLVKLDDRYFKPVTRYEVKEKEVMCRYFSAGTVLV